MTNYFLSRVNWGVIVLRSLQNQILVLMLGSLLLLSVSFGVALGLHMRERAVAAAIIKAQSDLATAGELIDAKYPGDWNVRDGVMYKGNVRISNNTMLVDYLSRLTGDTVTIFLGDTRVTTTVRLDSGERAIGTKVSDIVAQAVLKNGKTYLGEANVVGHVYQTAYKPLRDANGSIIGMFYVGISRAYDQEMIVNSLLRMALLGAGLTLSVMLLTWYFIRKVIIRPIREITLGTRDVATGHFTGKVEVNGPREIGELAVAFNQMVERLELVAGQFERVTGKGESLAGPEGAKEKPDRGEDLAGDVQADPAELADNLARQELPKGLNQATLRQIIVYLQGVRFPVTAEHVAEGVSLTRVTVRRYLEYLERCGLLAAELKYGTVGRPVKVFFAGKMFQQCRQKPEEI